MTVKAGRERDFVDACNELTAAVKANEPSVIYYEFFKLREPRRYAVLESFPSDEAEHAHMNSPWLAKVGPRIVDSLDGTWVREYLDPFEP
jgi:quinol monooxygenase YgiN